MTSSKFNVKEAISLVLVVAVAHSLLSLPKNLLEEQKSAVILNIIYVSILAILFSYLVYKLFKSFPGKDIIDISEFLGGKSLNRIKIIKKYFRYFVYFLFSIFRKYIT